MPQPIDLYYWPTPNGWKITIMLEECGTPYVIKPVNISRGDQFRPEFLAIAPNNRMPAIVDHDGPGGKPISDYTIADIACYGWASRADRQGTDMAEFPHLKRWFETVSARPAVQRGMAVKVDEAKDVDMRDPKVQAVLFGQRARS
jgi:glutathione S-transferase